MSASSKKPADMLAVKTAPGNTLVPKTPANPYFREVPAMMLEGQLSADPASMRRLAKASNAMSFWVGGGALFMH